MLIFAAPMCRVSIPIKDLAIGEKRDLWLDLQDIAEVRITWHVWPTRMYPRVLHLQLCALSLHCPLIMYTPDAQNPIYAESIAETRPVSKLIIVSHTDGGRPPTYSLNI